MTRRWCLVTLLLGATLCVPVLQAQVPESITQMSLVGSRKFQLRLRYLLVQQARVVLSETGVGATHGCRARYAQQVVAESESRTLNAAVMLVGGVNLVGKVVANADASLVDSSATDAAILSQISTFWDALAGCDTGS